MAFSNSSSTSASSAKIIHSFANQLTDAKRGANMFYENKTLYSYGYHFCVAKHVENDMGEKAVLITERKNSNTTNKQIWETRHATNHLNQIFVFDPKLSVEDNFKAWKVDAEYELKNLANARKPEKYLDNVRAIERKAEKYAAFLGVEIPIELKAIFDVTNYDQYGEYLRGEVDRLEQKRIKEEKENKTLLLKEIKDFLAYKTTTIAHRIDRDYLRMSKDGRYVFTSQGVTMALAIAKTLHHVIKQGTLSVGDIVDGWPVRATGSNIVIGCHSFPTKYLLQFGEKNF